MSNRGFGFGAGAAGPAPIPFGCATYTTAGTFSFTVPSGATKICVVCVGGGQGGGTGVCSCCATFGGVGGSLSYTNCIPVTAGETLTVVVGAGTTAGAPQVVACIGGTSSVSRGATVLVSAQQCKGVFGPNYGTNIGVGAVKYSSIWYKGAPCYCGPGGGSGAAGYAGNGGRGAMSATWSSTSATAGSGGGGGGGAAIAGAYYDSGAGGGGVGVVSPGQGSSGAGGTGGGSPFPTTAIGGGGGSGGTAGTNATRTGAPSNTTSPGQPGGLYGGGGGGGSVYGSFWNPGGSGARGAVRIIYGGTSRSFPTNA